ncbi:MAG: tRNA lysidine(34) synthetase TilS [Desulfobacterales bacterium]|nr:tRNA lysidine(34) synthetase TilS [Desulfobacterales bacterium]
MTDFTILYSDPLVRGVEKAIRDRDMLRESQSVLVGVSGGADSVALLYSLCALSSIHDWQIGIAHLNHGLRAKASDRDARFVEGLANQLNLSYYNRKSDLHAKCQQEGMNLEEGGRKARYEFYHEIADRVSFDKIAVGHQREDAAEQVLLNLLRGSGPEGLGGLAPVAGRVIRPLIETPRAEIERFLQDQSLSYCTDESNLDQRYTRNRIRNRLMPELASYNPRITQTLNRLAKVMREESEWIEDLLQPAFERALLRHEPERCVLELSAAVLLSLPVAARRRIVRRAVFEVKGDLRRIACRHIEDVLSVSATPGRSRQIHLPGQVRVLCSRDRVRFAREKKSLRSSALYGKKLETIPFAYTVSSLQAGAESVRIREIPARMLFQQLGIHDIESRFDPESQTALMDLDRVRFPLIIRNPRPGDRFVPLGMHGSVKIKDFFINNKVPPPVRARVPLVESADEIIWVGGMRIAEGVKITGTTKSVLKIALFPNQTDQQSSEESYIERL